MKVIPTSHRLLVAERNSLEPFMDLYLFSPFLARGAVTTIPLLEPRKRNRGSFTKTPHAHHVDSTL